MSLCIGLTGGVASGKSTVAAEFEKLQVPVIDADQVARDVVATGSPGLEAVIAHFGSEFRTTEGTLDRTRMREHVFAHPEERKTLEEILHPLIRARLREWREQLTAPYGIMMVPILIEGGFDHLCERILVVDVPEELQIERVRARDGSSLETARNILRAQASREERLLRADDIILNTGSPDDLVQKVADLHARFLKLAESQ